jgi:hypothetical protein
VCFSPASPVSHKRDFTKEHPFLISSTPAWSLYMDAQQHVQRQLLIDGYISNMFGSQAAEDYYVSLLRRESRLVNWYTRPAGSLVIFFAAPPYGLGTNHWAIDCATKNTGPVIPQQIWAPRNQSDAHRYVHNEQLHPPIFFVHRNYGNLGLPLIEAAAGNCMSLRDAEQIAPVGSSAHAQIRINVSRISAFMFRI